MRKTRKDLCTKKYECVNGVYLCKNVIRWSALFLGFYFGKHGRRIASGDDGDPMREPISFPEFSSTNFTFSQIHICIGYIARLSIEKSIENLGFWRNRICKKKTFVNIEDLMTYKAIICSIA